MYNLKKSIQKNDSELMETIFLLCLIVLLTPILGTYISNIFHGKSTYFHPILEPLEQITYQICQIQPKKEMRWQAYAEALLLFNFFGLLTVFCLQLIQQFLPFNPQNLPPVLWTDALNTAISAVTNTNWQYFGRSTHLSYFTQMLGLNVQNFLSAATGLAVQFALIRGIKRKSIATIGNFWEDIIRSVIYVLLPFSVIFSLLFLTQGVVQTFSPYQTVTTLENQTQTIPLGPIASQTAIKQLGSNGGGFFKANSSHPFENPSAISNFLQLLAILLIPTACFYAYGKIIESSKLGWMIFGTLFFLLCLGIFLSISLETMPLPSFENRVNLEGVDTRIGPTNAAFWATATTATSNGSYNSGLGSLSPLVKGVALFNMLLGEVIFGGLGVGTCRLMMFILLAVFLSGLLIGRTPQYYGKKIEQKKVLWIAIAIYLPAVIILLGSSIALKYFHHDSLQFTTIIYWFTSVANNNGSTLTRETIAPYFIFALIMLLSRLVIIIPSLALADKLARKKITPPTIGMFSTNTYAFHFILMCVIVFTALVIFFPTLVLGPFLEHLLLYGKS